MFLFFFYFCFLALTLAVIIIIVVVGGGICCLFHLFSYLSLFSMWIFLFLLRFSLFCAFFCSTRFCWSRAFSSTYYIDKSIMAHGYRYDVWRATRIWLHYYKAHFLFSFFFVLCFVLCVPLITFFAFDCLYIYMPCVFSLLLLLCYCCCCLYFFYS